MINDAIILLSQVDCGGGVLSYGRKKRAADRNQLPRQSRQLQPLPEDLADKLTYDPNLHQDVIVYDTPLRKQIFVDPGIKVNRFTDPTGGEVATGRGFTDENGGKINSIYIKMQTIILGILEEYNSV